MRLRLDKYLVGSAELVKPFKDVRAFFVIYSRNQLSIRKGSGAASAELYIGVSIKLTFFIKFINA